ncbi:MAG: hypothetical protein H0W59_10540 [Chloroflexia bacterium]|nr:hypothetical protein [Chloroflexia bacterium]
MTAYPLWLAQRGAVTVFSPGVRQDHLYVKEALNWRDATDCAVDHHSMRPVG